ncbi:L-Aspartase-like protein [Trichoderma austrokoningii]
MSECSGSHDFMNLIIREHVALKALLSSHDRVCIDGESLTVAQVVAVALHGKAPYISTDATVHSKVQQSVDFLEQELAQGETVYGVTTGFGGSADTRTKETEALQDGLIRFLNAGILLPSDMGHVAHQDIVDQGILRSHALPRAIIKATMLIRSNSLLRGHSGVRMNVIGTVMSLLEKDIIPVIPLRGSISASGDLGPLSYIAGAVQGSADIYMLVGTAASYGSLAGTVITAREALQVSGLEPQRLQAKEGLGIVNGTSASAAAAALVIYRAKELAVLSQFLTAMGTEALSGTANNYEPFISAIRPHRGQEEAAANITMFLQGSRLASHSHPQGRGLAQDRYALRTAPQWIGPQLEDLFLAQQQIEIELNSTTDNPLIDVEGGRIHHGGNFQAMSLTSAMEKTILAAQNLGRLLFAQCTELISNKFNNGLPPNLCIDEPSLSYTFKGIDITMAAYMSELASLAHPISSHVVNAEMGNQSLNSLALIAARRAMECIDILSLMSASYIYALCQSVDLRCLHLEFIKVAEPASKDVVRSIFDSVITSPETIASLERCAWDSILDSWSKLSHLDLDQRCLETSRRTVGDIVEFLSSKNLSVTLKQLSDYQIRVATVLSRLYCQRRERFIQFQETPNYLGSGTRRIYTYVRNHIGVTLHRGFSEPCQLQASSEPDNYHKSKHHKYTDGPTDMPSGITNGAAIQISEHNKDNTDNLRKDSDSIGSIVGRIYMSICNGKLPTHMLEFYEP